MKFAARVTLPCTISKIVQLSLCIYKSATTCWLHYTVTHVLSSFIMAFHYKTLHTIHLILIQYLPIIRQDLLCNKILSAYCCFECGYRNMYCKLWYCKQEVSFYHHIQLPMEAQCLECDILMVLHWFLQQFHL